MHLVIIIYTENQQEELDDMVDDQVQETFKIVSRLLGGNEHHTVWSCEFLTEQDAETFNKWMNIYINVVWKSSGKFGETKPYCFVAC